ncbi:histone-lysine N-methyltransferase, H3 lysine-9 specific SUVH4 isoform X1 [Cynara cardunculus var. scolymus]|uniref:histone-lysine N-methyltransferase, H3 lysine-9 specific SUVH4 isoform X1 n=2 Tax=Cynara cardunculus var. scolymus TaxID=59895 RepID=UPI000D627AC1|nr:histone-lysine N-methyltransferase, H3 lysine-9 specific SUVH4 isoform X1 [Cynara cardunculus var. scolymus]XP_024963741.1 histone-lysine N-methyltransferase, H3 lysine-9 specific SUVH4 isoform X1 [Cynara cardunculus var. scolymus]
MVVQSVLATKNDAPAEIGHTVQDCGGVDTYICSPARRISARIQKIESNKAAIRLRQREEDSLTKADKPVRKKQRLNHHKQKGIAGNVQTQLVQDEGILTGVTSNSDGGTEHTEKLKGEDITEEIETGSTSKGQVGERSAYAMVTDTIRAFNKHYLYFVQVEESRCKKDEDDRKKPKKPKSKKFVQNQDATEEKAKAKRPDLKALSKMMTSNTILCPQKRIGSIPGIDVGHQFFSRCEMVTVGFHNHWLNGIDYIGQSSQKEYPQYKLPITVAIVLSGQYEDDLDNCEDVVYTGQGGNNLLGNKRQISDQVMKRGNLGLKNCLDQDVPVRVIRGHQSSSSYVGKVYTYDGLYKVVKHWAEKGVSGFTVFKFQLKRIEGQPSLVTEQVHFAHGRIPSSVSEIRGLVCEDISGGLENIPIPATNLVDDPAVAPTGYTYCKSIQVSKSVVLPTSASGCNCQGSCTDPRNCACARLNGSDFPYVHRDGGRLIEPKAVVFECGPNCGCGLTCVNRTSQRGLRYRLEVFRTPKKGWAVRSWDYIPSGAPVCEYIGILKKTDDVDSNPENNYIFDIDCLQTMKGIGGRERRVGEVAMPSLLDKDDEKDSGPEFCIDAGGTGNVARFINHSCQPNLFVQCVLSVHHDITQARVILFAADNIPPLKELTYDYGYELNSVLGPDGKVKQLACFCGAPDCRKRLF